METRGWRRARATAAAAALCALSLLAAGCGALTEPSAAKRSSPVILFSPFASTSAYLMDLDGQKLHEWTTGFAPGYSVYLLPNGNLLRATSIPERPFSTPQGSNGGRAEILDWNSNPVWRYDYITTAGQQHHDLFWMPGSGHVLLVAWERRSAAEAIAAGQPEETLPAEGELWVDKIVEVDPATNSVVWEWRTWDHLLAPGDRPADHPELIDPNFVATPIVDWTHANAVFYNETLDQVVISIRNFSELWIVDHSTTTAEAAGHTGGRLGHGGDLVYRWGNPRAYGIDAPQQIFGQHNTTWIGAGLSGAGHMLLFDNGDVNTRPYSRAVEIATPLRADGSYTYDPATGFGPTAPAWTYVATPPESLFAPIISGAQRLASGNTLLTDGPRGHFFEVTPDGGTVWSQTVTDVAGGTGYQVFRAVRYEGDYPGLAGHTLVPDGPLRIPVAK